jgi:chemotaxis protein methyltransferase CheR
MTNGAGEPTLSPVEFDRYRAIVRHRSGIEIPDSRKPELERGVAAALEQSGAASPEALYELLAEKGPRGTAAFDAMVPALTINETHFFRNRPQMQALETEILPQLIEARRHTRRLRIWSAACSTGEEPYSLAILLDRLLPERDRWDVLIHGTDIDPTALAKARTGEYGNWSFREVPAGIKESYFTQLDEHRHELDPRIRRMVRFSRLNLVDDSYPAPENLTDRMDLVLCRNVLIYFREEVTQRIVDRLHESLVDEGWLVVGHAEPSQEIFHRYQVLNYPGTIVYRRSSNRAQGKPVGVPVLRTPPVVRPQATGHRPQGGIQEPAPVRPLRPVGGKQVAGPPAPPNAVEEAFALFESGASGEAINRLEQLAAESPRDARAPYLLAKIFASKVRFPEAEKWIDLAIANRELAPEAHYLRGIVLQEQGRLEDALEAFRRSLFLDQTFALGHFAAAGVFARTGQTARARKSLATVAELLEGKPADMLLPEGDGLTVGRLMELVALQQELVA